MLHKKIKLFIVLTMVISLVGLVSALRILSIQNTKEKTEEAKDFYPIQGKITALKKYRAIYTYQLNNQLMTDSILGFPCDPEIDYHDRMKVEKDLIGFTFPIFMSKKDSSIFLPSIKPHSFESYGMEMPDSLKYVYENYLNCGIWK